MSTQTEQEDVIVEDINDLSIYGQDKAVIDMQIATAKRYPRNIRRAVENAITVATMDKDTAESCTYMLPRSEKQISGKSVHLARIIAQTWGNMRLESKVIAIEEKQVVAQAIGIDLETNLGIKVEVRKRITDKQNRRFSEDMIAVTCAAASATAFRNVVYNVVPKNITDKVYDAAMDYLTGDLSDATKLMTERRKIFDRIMSAYNVTEAEILASVKKELIEHVGKEELIILIGFGTSIKEGNSTIEKIFRPKPERGQTSATKEDENVPDIKLKESQQPKEGKK